MKKSWIKKIIGGLSFTTALFIFQACYGTPQDFGMDVHVEGLVRSKTSGAPVKGIRVSGPESWQSEFTDDSGRFSLYFVKADKIEIKFDDVDAANNGNYLAKDTVLTNAGDEVFLNIYLENR